MIFTFSGDGGTFEPPTLWDDQGSENVKLVTLLPTSVEYTTLEQKFIQSVLVEDQNGQTSSINRHLK